jgi:hypothetical protein
MNSCPKCEEATYPCNNELTQEKIREGRIRDFGSQVERVVQYDPRCHAWQYDPVTKEQITVCGQTLTGTVSTNSWCSVSCALCWQRRRTPRVQGTLFPD